ncbi:MAG: DedA family protein [Candidatus Gracilibacteria bacterium]|nr:DedA family protein [Candidatus Gracilibacteria bacterium]
MDHYLQIVLDFFGGLDYTSITFLMALESSIFPVPSEAVMIPAGYLVASGKLNMFLVILSGTVGSVLGATLNYFILGQLIGKPFLLKYGKYILIKEKDYHKAEKLFLTNDKLYTFVGRLIPVIRHVISIPAGIFKMNFPIFTFITALGAGLWCTVLTLFGYYFGDDIISMVEKYTKFIGIMGIIFVASYIFKNFYRKK